MAAASAGRWRLPATPVLVLAAALGAGLVAVLWSHGFFLPRATGTGILMEAALTGDPTNAFLTSEVTVTWHLDDDPELGPTIVGDIGLPERRQAIRLSIRKNRDAAFPASHVVELSVEPTAYPDREIESIPYLSLKRRPEDTGHPIVGAPVKVADNRFWIALSNNPADVRANESLLKNDPILYFNMKYTTGREAALGIEKGPGGQAVFDRAFAAWSAPAP